MKIVKGKLKRPRRIVAHGVEGIGKSTLASGSPGAVFIGAEDGTSQLDIHRFPEPRGWGDIMGALDALKNEEHDYRTVVVDTLDWAEPMVWKFVCERDGKSDIGSYDWGRGYATALDQWRLFLSKLDTLRVTKKDGGKEMGVILLAHSHIKRFENPEGPDYDRYELKLHHKAAGIIKEWADCVLFCNYETYTHEQNGKTKGVDDGTRVMYTERRATFDAKNRENLPPKLPLSWDELVTAQLNLVQQYESLLKEVKDEKLKAKIEEGFKTAKEGKDKAKMAILVNYMKGKIEK